MILAFALVVTTLTAPPSREPWFHATVIDRRGLGANLRVELAQTVTLDNLGEELGDIGYRLWIERRSNGKWRRVGSVQVRDPDFKGGDCMVLYAGGSGPKVRRCDPARRIPCSRGMIGPASRIPARFRSWSTIR